MSYVLFLALRSFKRIGVGVSRVSESVNADKYIVIPTNLLFMDTRRFDDILDDRFGNKRPTTSDFVIVDARDHEIIIEWHSESVSVNLYTPHSKFPHIVPDDVIECDYFDSPNTNPSDIDEIPSSLKHSFNEVSEALKDKYGLKASNPTETKVCNACMGGTLSFVRFLDE